MAIGLTLENIKTMDVGIMLDLITSKSNMFIKEKKRQHTKTKTKQWRWATQSDFDRLG